MPKQPEAAVRWVGAIAVAATAVVLYLPALGYGFVVDDHHLIVGNPHVENRTGVLDAFSVGMWEFAGRTPTYYRPLMYVAYASVRHLVGADPWGFHALNLLVHATASLLAWGVARQLLARGRASGAVLEAAAASAGLVFAVHPVHVEAVAWAAALPDVACGALCLAAFALYLRSETGSKAAMGGALAAFFAATLFKEPAIVLPAVLAVYEFVRPADTGVAVRLARRVGPFVAIAGVYLAVRVAALGAFVASVPGAGNEPPGRILLSSAGLFTRYLRALVFPDSFGFGAVYRPPAGPAIAILSIVAVSLFAWAAVVSVRRRGVVAVALAFVALPLAPSFRLLVQPQGAGTPFAERFLYLPVFGLAVLVGVAVARAARGPRWARIATVGVVALALAAAILEVRARLPSWRDDRALWAASVEASPENAVGHLNLGYELLRVGETAAGRRHLARAVELDPGIPGEELRRAVAWARAGRTGRALFGLHAVLLLEPGSASAYFNLGLVHETRGERDRAIAAYRAALRIDPDLADGHNNLGVALAEAGDLVRARFHFEQAVRLRPDDADFAENLDRARRALEETGPGTDREASEVDVFRGASNPPTG